MNAIASLSIVLLAAVASMASANDTNKTALLIVDVQDCFMEAAGTSSGVDGSLSVADTASIVPLINQLRDETECLFDVVIRSQDFHPPHHISFGPTHGLEPFAHLSSGKGELPITCVHPSSGSTEDASCCPSYHLEPYDCETKLCPNTNVTATNDAYYAYVLASPACTVCKETPDECFETTQAMWTNHCLQTGDSSFPPGLITNKDTDIIVQKGSNPFVDSYSAFMDNTRKLKTPLDQILTDNQITTIYVVGIATDYCVYYSTLDAISLGYETIVVIDATRGIANETVDAAQQDMLNKGATIMNAADILALDYPCSAPNDTTTDTTTTTSTSNASSAGVGGSTIQYFGGLALLLLGLLTSALAAL